MRTTDKYTIWDSHVDDYLWLLQKRLLNEGKESFAPKFRRKDLWNYPKFVEIIRQFQSYYKLDDFGFKDIDKFIWPEGAPVAK
jgi:hypothetical protein